MTKNFLLLSAVFGFIVLSCNTPSNFKTPTGKRLRVLVSENFEGSPLLIGGTTGSWAFDSISGKILDAEFSYVTPENDFKHRIIRSTPSSWNWDSADAWIKHIAENDQVLRMHGPISPQCARWICADTISPQALENEMKVFMKELCMRYNGVQGITMLDVVNETVHKGEWKKDEPGIGVWELPWYRIGQDTDSLKTPLYISYAFEVANTYAPNIKLIYNQDEHPNEIESWNIIKNTIHYLRSKGLRVDGIGWQAHVNDGWASDENLNHLRSLIDWSFANNLSFHVTEATVWMDSTNVNSTLETHAETYSTILQVLLEKHNEGEVSWNAWNVDDANAWHADKRPTLFDEKYRPKPAYYAIQRLLEEKQ